MKGMYRVHPCVLVLSYARKNEQIEIEDAKIYIHIKFEVQHKIVQGDINK